MATADVLAATEGRPGERYLVTGDDVSPKSLSLTFAGAGSPTVVRKRPLVVFDPGDG